MIKHAIRALNLLFVCTLIFLLCSCQPANTTTVTSVTTTLLTTAPTTTVPTTTASPDIDPFSITLENYPVIDGSTATIPLAISLIKKITGCSDAVAEESIAFNTTDASYHALADGKSDLLLVYAPAQPTIDELDVFNKMDVKEIGLDALVFIVNEDNPVKSLTGQQVRDIYSGKITNWSEVGGKDIAIMPFQRPELSGSQTLMLSLMMKETTMIEPTTETVSASMADALEDIASYNNSANAIGYSVYYYAKNMYTQPGLKFVAIDGVLPSNETINDKTYGYSSPFYGIIPLEPKSEAKSLRDWLLTADGQQLLSDCGYVPILKLN